MTSKTRLLTTLGIALCFLTAAFCLLTATGLAQAQPATAFSETFPTGLPTPGPAALSPGSYTVSNVCAAPKPNRAACMALEVTPKNSASADNLASTTGGAQPQTGPTSGLTPAQLESAYQLPPTTSVSGGQTVAIVDSYDDPTAESDLNVYSSQFGLPACTTLNGCFTKENQTGQSSPLPTHNNEWSTEISLDLDMVHSICQNCHILLIEANTNSFPDLEAAENEAATQGATEITNSYGTPDNEGITQTDNAAYDHKGIVDVAAAGDDGYDNGSGAPLFPASSPSVVAVGGTSLTFNSVTQSWNSTAWQSGGGGCSSLFTAPAWQQSLSVWSQTGCGTARLSADVSAVADPSTGVAIYYAGGGGWLMIGGTSASSPIIAAEYALAGGANGVDYPAQTLYGNANTSAYFDITSGNNNFGNGFSCSTSIACNAAPGYDGPTGLGSPVGLSAFTAEITAAPENVSPPSISGNPGDQYTLRATDGVWSQAYNAGFQWEECDASGNNCAPVSGQGTSSRYTLTSSDIGSTIRVVVTASNTDGSNQAVSVPTAVVHASAPANTAAPTIADGESAIGTGSVSLQAGEWLGSGTISYSYQWQLCNGSDQSCANIANAVADTYSVPESDIGSDIDVVVTASNAVGSQSVASAPAFITDTTITAGPSLPTDVGEAQAITLTNATCNTGDVLIAGGFGPNLTIRTATSLYNPATGAITSSGNMSGNAFDFRMVQLPSGEVLAIGGFNSGSLLTGAAEIYDPCGNGGVGSWSATGSLNTPRQSFTATALDDGDVIVTGGLDTNNNAVCSIERYSVSSGTWSNAGNLDPCAELQTATLLPNGNIWIAGGVTSVTDDSNTATEIYNPVTQLTTSSVDLPAPRYYATATLITGSQCGADGDVLIAGGGNSYTGLSTTSYLFDYRANNGEGAITTTGNMVTARLGDAVTATGDGQIVFVGGVNDGTLLASVETYNPCNESFQLAAGLSTPVNEPAVSTLADGQVFVAGGFSDTTFSSPVGNTQILSPASPPTVQITSAPSGDVSEFADNSVGFSISRGTAPIATTTCTLNGTPTPCGNEVADLNDLQPGQYQFVVTSTGLDGLLSQASASWTVVKSIEVSTPGPAITGNPVVGSVLTSSTGTFLGSGVTYTYQWDDCDTNGANCHEVSQDGAASTYVATASDVGQTLVAIVTATNSAGSVQEQSAASPVIESPVVASTPAPVISGQTVVGQTLSATQGTFTGGTVNSYAYQWYRGAGNGTPIGTDATYTTTSADIGQVIHVIVTARSETDNTNWATEDSADFGPIVVDPPTAASPAPTISGSSKVGATLNATNGTFVGSAITVSYQWERCDSSGNNCEGIEGATSASYTLVGADTGSTLVVVTTASNTSGTANETSSDFGPITLDAPSASSPAPVISGQGQVGSTLTATSGTYGGGPMTLSYQWEACDSTGANCEPIAGANNQSYVVASSDVGSVLVAMTTAENASGLVSEYSAALGPIGEAPPAASTPLPAISGQAQVGSTLETNAGVFTGGAASISYQWQRCDSAGANCTPIEGATSPSYAIASGDAGSTLEVVTTAVNASGEASETSAPTALVQPQPTQGPGQQGPGQGPGQGPSNGNGNGPGNGGGGGSSSPGTETPAIVIENAKVLSLRGDKIRLRVLVSCSGSGSNSGVRSSSSASSCQGTLALEAAKGARPRVYGRAKFISDSKATTIVIAIPRAKLAALRKQTKLRAVIVITAPTTPTPSSPSTSANAKPVVVSVHLQHKSAGRKLARVGDTTLRRDVFTAAGL